MKACEKDFRMWFSRLVSTLKVLTLKVSQVTDCFEHTNETKRTLPFLAILFILPILLLQHICNALRISFLSYSIFDSKFISLAGIRIVSVCFDMYAICYRNFFLGKYIKNVAYHCRLPR